VPAKGAVAALVVKAHQPLAQGLGVATRFGGDGRSALAVPATRDHPGAHDPVAGRVAAAGEAAHLARFRVVAGQAGTRQLRHGRLLQG
jgi:hypothetical protein